VRGIVIIDQAPDPASELRINAPEQLVGCFAALAGGRGGLAGDDGQSADLPAGIGSPGLVELASCAYRACLAGVVTVMGQRRSEQAGGALRIARRGSGLPGQPQLGRRVIHGTQEAWGC
jgi:hypothetical protein